MKRHERNLRPGGTISGPALFTLADFAVYAAVIGALGEAGIGAVTTSLNITFLAKPEARDLVASVRLVRLEHRLAVGEVELYSDGVPGMVAHAVATYALPADARRAGQD
jgi:acyl-coenzyme A thioesterase PaaI-like protein